MCKSFTLLRFVLQVISLLVIISTFSVSMAEASSRRGGKKQQLELAKELEVLQRVHLADSLRGAGRIQLSIDTLTHLLITQRVDTNSFGYVEILKNLGLAYSELGEYSKAFESFRKELDAIARIPLHDSIMADADFRILSLNEKIENLDVNLFHAKRALNWYRKAENNLMLSNTYTELADLMAVNYQIKIGSLFAELALHYEDDNNDDMLRKASLEITLGSLYLTYDLPKAIEHYTNYYELVNQYAEDSITLGWAGGRYGWVLMLGKRYDDALIPLKKGQTLLEPIYGTGIAPIAHFYLTLGELYVHLNQLDSAKFYLDRTYEIYSSIDSNYFWLDAVHRMYSKFYEKQGDMVNAIRSQDKSLYFRTNIAHQNPDIYYLPDLDEFISKETTRFGLREKKRLFRELYKQTGNPEDIEASIHNGSLLVSYIFGYLYNELFAENQINFRMYLSITEVLDENHGSLSLIEGHESYSYFKSKVFNDISLTKAFALQLRAFQGELYKSQGADSLFRNMQLRQIEMDRLEHAINHQALEGDSLLAHKSELADIYIDHLRDNNWFERVRAEKGIERPVQVNSAERIIQQLGANAMVIDYFITDFLLSQFIITSSGIRFHSQPIDSTFHQLAESYSRALRLASPRVDDYSQQLSELLLGASRNELKEKTEVTIIPHGNLFGIPFETLPVPGTSSMLISQHQVSYHYSANLMRFDTERGHRVFAAFAPSFHDPSTATLAYANTLRGDTSFINSDIHYRNGEYLAPIPHTLQEVEEIVQIVAESFDQKRVFTESMASKTNFLQSVGDADIIHIATHGHTSLSKPGLSGLFFTQNLADDDGYLYLHELYGLETNANLVVLSACRTGVGFLLENEGALALPRGFISSGVPNVIASLWKVHDERTKDLMVAFYRHLFNGNTYAEALRLAKLECIERGFLPLDWAGFVLIGG